VLFSRLRDARLARFEEHTLPESKMRGEEGGFT
jgi:hypothetical protein